MLVFLRETFSTRLQATVIWFWIRVPSPVRLARFCKYSMLVLQTLQTVDPLRLRSASSAGFQQHRLQLHYPSLSRGSEWSLSVELFGVLAQCQRRGQAFRTHCRLCRSRISYVLWCLFISFRRHIMFPGYERSYFWFPLLDVHIPDFTEQKNFRITKDYSVLFLFATLVWISLS